MDRIDFAVKTILNNVPTNLDEVIKRARLLIPDASSTDIKIATLNLISRGEIEQNCFWQVYISKKLP